MIKTWAIIAALFLVQWFFLFSLNPPSWDGAFYYAYARSAVMDGDLHLANDLQLGYPAAPQFAERKMDEQRTVTDHVENTFAPGTATQWLPLMVVGRLLNLNGHEPLFLRTAATISALTGLATFLLSAHIARTVLGDRRVTLAIGTMMFATPLIYYQFRDPWYSHTMSAFAGALIVWAWLRWQKSERWIAHIGIGLLISFAVLVRWQNVMYAILPMSTAVYAFIDNRNIRTWHKPFTRLTLSGIGTLTLIPIQLFLWKQYFDSWLTIPMGDSFMDWTAPWLSPLIFSPFMGIVAWFPLFVPAVIGLLWLSKRTPRLIIPLILILLLELYVNGSTRDWFGGGGFGPRKQTTELAIFAVGYAGFIALLRSTSSRWGVWIGGFISLFLGWHHLMLLRYGLEQKLGGRILSKAAEWFWEIETDTWREYVMESGRLMFTNFWLYPNSPFGQLRNGMFPADHLIGLGAGIILTIGIAIVVVIVIVIDLLRSRLR